MCSACRSQYTCSSGSSSAHSIGRQLQPPWPTERWLCSSCLVDHTECTECSFKTHQTNQTTFSQRGPRVHYCTVLSGAALRTWRSVLQLESLPFAADPVETVCRSGR